MVKKKIPSNEPMRPSDRVAQMLSAITLDMRLEFALEALELAQEALREALDLTAELESGFIPDITDLDGKIISALASIDEALDEKFSVVRNDKIMRHIVRQVEAAKRPRRIKK
ncbi:hypothetical protein [Dyella amyloliquefaciens]|uniref:hypothetical protein n=1 Tax=Dyella amyloliquefaciens TaxID=1770545 RepID=UPI00102EBC44|nr:hypothetical protein [Dyella amyloliquefaciens]